VAQRGGRRVGAGRKPGTRTRLQQTAIDVAGQVLSEVDVVAIWKKLILQQEKPQVVARVMAYLSDRLYGRPVQSVQGNPEQPIMIQLQWSSTPVMCNSCNCAFWRFCPPLRSSPFRWNNNEIFRFRVGVRYLRVGLAY
jgi:hypothetical protein